MSLYTVLLFAHIVAAVTWIGGASFVQLFGIRASRTGEARRIEFLNDVAWIGQRVLTPAVLLTLAAGIGLVLEGGWGFAQDWVIIALALFGVALAAGFGYFGPEMERLQKLVGGAGGITAQIERRAHRLTLIGRIELGLLYLILFDMTVKPQFADTAAIVAGLGGMALWTALMIRLTRAPQARGRALAVAAE